MAVASLDYTKQYADDTFLTEAQLDAAFESIETYTQTAVVNNLNQIKADAFPKSPAYDYDNDGSGNLTNTLYDKQAATISYQSATITLSTATNTWTEATTALRLALTPEATGRFMLSYNFTHVMETTAGFAHETRWGLVNVTSGGTLISQTVENDPGGAEGHRIAFPLNISYVHNFTSTAAATFSLYYNNTRFDVGGTPFHFIDNDATNKMYPYGQIHKI